MRKKIIRILIILIVLIVCFIHVDSKLDLYINWKIYLPGVQRRTVIYDSFFRTGDQISIFKYYNKGKMKMIRDMNHFDRISPENIYNIQENLLDFYDRLGPNTDKDSGKVKYDENIQIKQLLNINNYYLIKREDESYIIMIMDMNNKKIYAFISVR